MPAKNLNLDLLDSPWKISLELGRLLTIPFFRIYFFIHGIKWGSEWKIYGRPIIQRHRKSSINIGRNIIIRSSSASNPLGPYRPAIISTRTKDSAILIGNEVGITGGTICAANRIEIGNRVWIGANTTIVDTDFHPLDPVERLENPLDGANAPVVIEDDVFIGMNCLILKGVTIGKGSVIGAGSVVSGDVPAGVIFAGNPARLIKMV